LEKKMYIMKINDPFTTNLKSEYGPSIETDLNGIASEGVNRQ